MEGQDSTKYIKKRRKSQSNSSQEGLNEGVTDKSDIFRESDSATYFSYNPRELDSILKSPSKTKTTSDEYFGANPQELDKILQKSPVHPDYREKAKELQEQMKERERLSQALATENYYRRYNLPKPKVTVRNSPSPLKNKSPPIPNNSQKPNNNPKDSDIPSEENNPTLIPKFNPRSHNDLLGVLGGKKMNISNEWIEDFEPNYIPNPPKNRIEGQNFQGQIRKIPNYNVSPNEKIKIEGFLRDRTPNNLQNKFKDKFKEGHIYILHNIKNKKIYVGETKLTLEKRLEAHIRRNNLKNHNTHLSRAMKKYGSENFFIQNIHTVKSGNKWLLQRLENYYILKYNSMNHSIGYNHTLKGGGGVFSKETIEKIRKKMKGRPSPTKGIKQSPEWVEKRSKKNRGKKRTEAQKQYLRDNFSGENSSFYGKHHKEESKKKISRTRKELGLGPTPDSIKKAINTSYNKYISKIFHIKTMNNDELIIFRNKIEKKFHQMILNNKKMKDLMQQFQISYEEVRGLSRWIYGDRNIQRIKEKKKKPKIRS